jgi:ATP-binding cassette subfamily B protein
LSDKGKDWLRSYRAGVKDVLRLVRFLVEEWHLFLASLVLLSFASFLSTMIPRVTGEAIDYGLSVKQFGVVIEKSITILALAGISAILRFGSTITGVAMAQRVVHKLRSRAFESLVYQPMKYFDYTGVGHVITRVVNDTDRIAGFLSFGFRMFLNAILLMFMSLYFMLSMNLLLTFVCLIAILIVILSNTFSAMKLRPAVDLTRQQIGVMASIATNDITGIKTVKGLNLEKIEIERFDNENRKFLDISIGIAKFRAIFTNINFLVFGVTSFAIILYGGYSVIKGVMSIGMIAAFLGYMTMIMWPASMLGFVLFDIQLVSVSARRVLEILESSLDKDDDNSLELNDIKGEIVFDNITFGYTEKTTVLNNVSFSIKPGEIVVIVGPPGSGKSTLLKLILSFYKPSSGRILIDGIDVARVKKSSLRRVVGYIPQIPYIFSGTIAENIAFGNPRASIEDIIRAARIAKIDGFIETLPGKYNTVIGERGLNLSGGQRQRIAIARALVHNPKILLLDDPTSNLDAETEKELIKDLKDIARGRTVLIVTQRPILAEIADRVLVLESGCIVEEGSMRELLNRKGIFYKMYISMVGSESGFNA